MPKYEPFFVDGKPTDKFKRQSSFYERTIKTDGTVGFQFRRSVIEAAWRKSADSQASRVTDPPKAPPATPRRITELKIIVDE